MFTTPHLHTVRERVQIGGQPVTEDEWASSIEIVAGAIAEVESANPELGKITAFELNTAMALSMFETFDVELAVIEVGLGGRLDATNVVTPAASVITPVSIDHEAILGDTLAEIAREKAGIIKRGVPVVVAAQPPSADETISTIAGQLGAPRHSSGTDWSEAYSDGVTTLAGPWGVISDVKLGLRGAHQAQNAGAALMALSLAVPASLEDRGSLVAGLRALQWPGRFEIVRDAPTIVVDGAHNAASIEVLAHTLNDIYPSRELIVVFGAYRDKDLPSMLAQLGKLNPLIIATQSASPRALSPALVRGAAGHQGLSTMEQGSVPGALRLAVDAAGPDAVIVATGSLSIVAEAREYLGLATVSQTEREVLRG